ncbi:MAG: glycosyltransferase [Piscirickettsiaceae bacterium]|nr:glycosyltransferase [Piscirickettsiaceae bacterium]
MHELDTLSVTVAIELDNAAFDGGATWMENANTLLKWISHSNDVNVVEVLIVHNQNYLKPVSRYMEQLPVEWGDRVRSLSLEKEQAHYYIMKNSAANQAKGEIIVFLDCDLTPIHGSFKDLVEPLYSGDQVASNGYTCFPANNFISKMYALFWYFSIYHKLETLDKYQLHVSNFAVRKDWFLPLGFDVQRGGFKVCCYLLAQRLKQEGYDISRSDVWFQHELWNHSIKFFIWRAIVAGRDRDKKFSIRYSKKKYDRVKAAVKFFLLDIKRIYRRHINYRHVVGLNRFQAILSFCVGILFFSLLRTSQVKAALSAFNNNIEVVPCKFIT